MKNTKVTLVPLTDDDREQFILDNQWAFKYGAIEEFGKRDDHLDFDGEIISRKTIERCIDSPDSETYRIVVDGRKVGGVILKINKETHHNELEILFVSPEEHTKGIGYGAWHCVLWLEILAPKLVNMKTAFVNVKMNITLLKVRSASFPNLSFGVKNFNRLPSTVTDTLGVFLRRNK